MPGVEGNYPDYNPSGLIEWHFGAETLDDMADITLADYLSIDSNLDSNPPKNFNLSQNYPSPCNPSTKIKFDLPKPESVKIEVYNILGQKIHTLLNKSMPAGYHEVEFNGQNLSSGIYLYRIEAGDWQDVKKMILLR